MELYSYIVSYCILYYKVNCTVKQYKMISWYNEKGCLRLRAANDLTVMNNLSNNQ